MIQYHTFILKYLNQYHILYSHTKIHRGGKKLGHSQDREGEVSSRRSETNINQRLGWSGRGPLQILKGKYETKYIQLQ